jgi:hypothetical protein
MLLEGTDGAWLRNATFLPRPDTSSFITCVCCCWSRWLHELEHSANCSAAFRRHVTNQIWTPRCSHLMGDAADKCFTRSLAAILTTLQAAQPKDRGSILARSTRCIRQGVQVILEPTRRPIRWVFIALSPGVKRPQLQAYHTRLYSLCLNAVHTDNFTCVFPTLTIKLLIMKGYNMKWFIVGVHLTGRFRGLLPSSRD